MSNTVVAKLSNIRAALALVLKDLKTANGYLTEVPDSNIHPKFDKTIQANNKDSDFPKVFVILDSGKSTPLPSNRSSETCSYIIMGVFKKLQPSDDPNLMAEQFVMDIKALCQNNSSLSGLVQRIWLDTFATDSGHLDPEAAVLCRVSATYFVDFND